MKRAFAILISMFLLLVSCVKVEDVYTRDAELNRTEIVFNSVTTKAIIEGTAMVDHFGVYGWVVPGDYSANGGYLMKNAEYTETGDAANGAAYFWPKSDNNTGIDFIFTAYSQFDSNVTWANDSLTLAIPTLTQALIDNPDDFDDVLWTQTTVNRHQNSTHERVSLNFKHALSWLQFNAQVVDNTPVKWVKIKSVGFGEYVPGTPGVPATPDVPAYNDTTDTWMNLRRSSNVDGSPTRTSTDGGATYVDNFEIPAALVAEIKSYYSINNGTAGDYDLHMGNSVWPSAEIRQLRVVKDVPAAYRMPVETTSGDVIVFFNALKYLEDSGYKVTYRISGGKPAVFDYPIIDLFVNGTAYTIVGFNFGVSSVYDANVGGNVPALNYTIVEHPAVPGNPGTPAVAAHASEGVYVNGSIVLPTKSLISETPVAVYSGQKDTLLNYCSAQVDTLLAGSQTVLGNALVVPQPVPTEITVVFDICIENATGDVVVFTDRRITRVINAGKDADQDADYVASWIAANKYIYNFKFNGDTIDFNALVSGWTVGNNNYHVWDY